MYMSNLGIVKFVSTGRKKGTAEYEEVYSAHEPKCDANH